MRELVECIYDDDMASLRSKIEAGADVNEVDWYGWYPIHYAGFEGSAEAAIILLGSGANIDARDVYGMTAWDLALQRGNKEVCRVFEEHASRGVLSK